MSRFKKIILIFSVAVILLTTAGFIVLKFKPDILGVVTKQGSTVNSEQLVDEEMDIDEQLSILDGQAIDKAKLEELKEERTEESESQEGSQSIGDLTMDQGAYESGSTNVSSPVIDPISRTYKPYIDWSDDEVNSEELETMIDIAAHLYEDNLNKSRDGKYVVEAALPTVEELENFSNKVFFYVVNGVLTINLKVNIYDLEAEVVKEVLAPISVKYNLDEVELAE